MIAMQNKIKPIDDMNIEHDDENIMFTKNNTRLRNPGLVIDYFIWNIRTPRYVYFIR